MAVHAVVPGGMRLLLVHGEPEPELARTMAQEGHDVLAVAEDGRPAQCLGVFKPEVVLVVAPDAADICHDLRRQAPDVAIVAIVPSRNVDQVIAALEAGADDCLGRPFHRAELIARVIAARRRGAVTPERSVPADVPTLDGAA
ncbi:MAG: response regulator transcription factor [Solirubrobacteraceae bacterium]